MTDVEYEPRLEFIFKMRVKFATRLKYGPTIAGLHKGFLGVVGGSIEGPRLSGRIVPNSGGDYPTIRPDGVVEFNTMYMLEADDGTLIQINNRGCRHASPDVSRRMERYDDVDPSEYYFRVAPVFEAPVGPHNWLARTVIVGAAHRHETHSDFTFYAVM